MQGSRVLALLALLAALECSLAFVRYPFVQLQRQQELRERQRRASEFESYWPTGTYCLLQGSDGQCPPGFEQHGIRLTVQQDFKQSETAHDGQKAVQIGNIGASYLRADAYDDTYILTLITCCRA